MLLTLAALPVLAACDNPLDTTIAEESLTPPASAALATAAGSFPATAQLYQALEASFTASHDYANPYREAAMSVAFTGPDGRTRELEGFWDGGRTWLVRFAPDRAGNWSYLTRSADAGLNGRRGSFSVASGSARGGIRTRRGAPHHFEYQNGKPFWWFGDTNWRLFGTDAAEGLTGSSVEQYLSTRAAQGFNVIQTSLTALMLGKNDGGPIWIDLGREVLNPGYFRVVDERLRSANRKGLTVGLALTWASDPPFDWASYPSQEARLRFVRYAVARYSAHDVFFIVSGEWDKYNTFTSRTPFFQLGEEVAARDPHRRQASIHPFAKPDWGRTSEFNNQSWYSYGDYQQNYRELNSSILASRKYGKPVVNAEYAYYLRDKDGDGRVDKPNSATREQFRNASYDIAMAGGYFVTGFGSTYFGGYRHPGKFNVADPKNDVAEADLGHLRRLFTSLAYERLAPRNDLVTGGGTGAVRYALVEPGRQYLVYVRGATGRVSLGLGGVAAATYSVRRFDPRRGSYTALPDYRGSGPLSLAVPDRNDHLFVLLRK